MLLHAPVDIFKLNTNLTKNVLHKIVHQIMLLNSNFIYQEFLKYISPTSSALPYLQLFPNKIKWISTKFLVNYIKQARLPSLLHFYSIILSSESLSGIGINSHFPDCKKGWRHCRGDTDHNPYRSEAKTTALYSLELGVKSRTMSPPTQDICIWGGDPAIRFRMKLSFLF